MNTMFSFGSLVVVGMIWGERLRARSNNRYGKGAAILRAVFTTLWLFGARVFVFGR